MLGYVAELGSFLYLNSCKTPLKSIMFSPVSYCLQLSSSAKSQYLFLHKTDRLVLGVIASSHLSLLVFSWADTSVVLLLHLTPQSLSCDQEIKSCSHWLSFSSVVITLADQYFPFIHLLLTRIPFSFCL